jgi:hypothetical protein
MPRTRPRPAPTPVQTGAFGGDDGEDLAPRQAEVGEQAEFLPARQHLRREARGDAEQADRDRDRLQPVGDGEAAVEDPQRRRADLARRRELEQGRVEAARGGEPAQLVFDRGGAGAGSEPEGEIVDALVAAQPAPVGAVDDDRSRLARIVAPDAANEDAGAAAVGKRQRERRSGRGAVEVDDGLADIGGDRAGGRGDELAGERQARRRIADVARE